MGDIVFGRFGMMARAGTKVPAITDMERAVAVAYALSLMKQGFLKEASAILLAVSDSLGTGRDYDVDMKILDSVVASSYEDLKAAVRLIYCEGIADELGINSQKGEEGTEPEQKSQTQEETNQVDG